MAKQWSRRTFLSATLAGAAMSSCKGGLPSKPQEGAPQAGDITLLPGGSIPRRRLGRTGVEVSLLGLGGHHIGRPKDEQEGIRLIRMALDHGINFLDNCWDYHAGESERRMGKALEDGYRQKAFLMTKIDGRTRAAAAAQLEQCLSRLATDVIDLVQVHEVIRMSDPARVFGPDGAMEALISAQKAGKIRFIGFTGHKDPAIHLAMLKTALDHGFVFDTVQMPLNVMDAHYKSFEKQVLPVLQEHDIGVLGMKSLGDGHLLKSGAVSARECLDYALSLPTSVVITGCESVGVLEQALDVGMRFQPLTSGQRASLLGRTVPYAMAGEFEKFKTSEMFDGTTQHPEWLESANI
jgi:aryl-alcohol dehydrogenase-like predicted oxidoreductase